MVTSCCFACRVLANKAMQLVEPLLHSQDAPDGLPPGFLNDFVARFENDGLSEVCAAPGMAFGPLSDIISAARCGFPPVSAILQSILKGIVAGSSQCSAHARMILRKTLFSMALVETMHAGSVDHQRMCAPPALQLLPPVLQELEKGMRQCKITDPFIAYLRVCRGRSPSRRVQRCSSAVRPLAICAAMVVVGAAILRLG
jgi:hypothetical protein